MDLDTSAWSGDGDFTIRLLETLRAIEEIAFLRLQDAPASGTGAGYAFLANEIFVSFVTDLRLERAWRFGLIPVTRRVIVPRLRLAGLEARLAPVEGVGSADYSDNGMLQYLRTERVIPPYQTRGYKLVEMVRVYEVSRSEG
ncbi:MAG TPA: hypothetical protein VGK32_14750 [Vicinamibacterales bacterium]|jgi:hypothetical protein